MFDFHVIESFPGSIVLLLSESLTVRVVFELIKLFTSFPFNLTALMSTGETLLIITLLGLNETGVAFGGFFSCLFASAISISAVS